MDFDLLNFHNIRLPEFAGKLQKAKVKTAFF